MVHTKEEQPNQAYFLEKWGQLPDFDKRTNNFVLLSAQYEQVQRLKPGKQYLNNHNNENNELNGQPNRIERSTKITGEIVSEEILGLMEPRGDDYYYGKSCNRKRRCYKR